VATRADGDRGPISDLPVEALTVEEAGGAFRGNPGE